MLFYEAKTPIDYQEFFFRQVGLLKTRTGEFESLWKNTGNGFVYTYGTMDQIQTGIGNYTVLSDFMVEYQYDAVYLHFGIIYEGITYSLTEDSQETKTAPSPFLTVANASRGINCWKKGQHLKGVEISIEMNYLNQVLLPFLGFDGHVFEYLEDNVRYINIPDEMQNLMKRIEELLFRRKMTMPLQLSLCLEFLSLMLHPQNRTVFNCNEPEYSRYLVLGTRRIRFTREDFQKIVAVRERLKKDAASFPTIYELSRELDISEQKLKAGFKEIYQQTIWDYANGIRMNTAVRLLSDTDLSVGEISLKIGYQSQAAFINVFKKWCGTTPGQFRIQMQSPDSL